MKRAYILALCIALCLTMTLAGTISYLSDTDSDVNIMTTGNVDIDLMEFRRLNGEWNGELDDFHSEVFKEMYPLVGSLDNVDGFGLPMNRNFIDKMVLVQSHSRNADAYLRVFIGVPSALRNIQVNQGEKIEAIHLYMGETVTIDKGAPVNAADWLWEYDKEHSLRAEIDGVPYDLLCYNYTKELEPGEVTPVLLGGVYMDTQVDNGDDPNGGYTIWHKGVEYPLEFDFSNGVQIPVYVQAMQADGFDRVHNTFEANRDYAFEEGGMNGGGFVGEIHLVQLPDGPDGPGDPGPDSPGGEENTVTVSKPIQALQEAQRGYHSGKFMRILLEEGGYDFADGEPSAFLGILNAAGDMEGDPYQELIVAGGQKVEINMGGEMMPEPIRLVVQDGGVLELNADVFVK